MHALQPVHRSQSTGEGRCCSEKRSAPFAVVGDYNGLVMRVTGHSVAAAPESVRVGVLATVTMDAALVAASRLGGDRFASDLIGLDPVGRWAMGMMRGQVWHDDLPGEPPVRGEAAVGLAVHYMTGIALTQVYLALLRRTGSRSSLLEGDGLRCRDLTAASARHAPVVGPRGFRTP